MKMSILETVIQYCDDVLNDRIPACIYIKQAVGRFLEDLDDDRYYYDDDSVDEIVNFCENFNLTETTPPKKLVLQPFQLFIVANLYGLYRKDTLTKKYRIAYIELGRGNGKTQLIIILSLYELLFGTDSQVILAADTTKQVVEVDLDKCKKLVHQIDPSGKKIRVYYNKIIYGTNKLIVTSNESKPIDGLSGSYMVVDELHLMKSLSVYNTLKSSMVKRNDNILFLITTAGNDKNSECYKMRSYCSKVLSGELQDPSQFAMIFTIDEGDDYTIERNWYKPNPLLGIAVNKDTIASEVLKSKQNEQEKASILQRHFNVWAKENDYDAFIPETYVEAAMADIYLNDPEFKGEETCVGVDLSVNNDITSVTYLIVKDDIFYFFNDYYFPREALGTKRNKEMYEEAAKGGFINMISGNTIDYDLVVKHIVDTNEDNPVKLISFDKYMAGDFSRKLSEMGFNMIKFSQLASSMNSPLMEMQHLFLIGKIKIQRNPLTKWMFGNVILKRSYTGLITIDKTNSGSNKIDCVASMADALGGQLSSPNYDFKVW